MIGEAGSSGAGSKRRRPASSGLQSVLEGVGELWGAEEYEEEYDLRNFLSTLS